VTHGETAGGWTKRRRGVDRDCKRRSRLIFKNNGKGWAWDGNGKKGNRHQGGPGKTHFGKIRGGKESISQSLQKNGGVARGLAAVNGQSRIIRSLRSVGWRLGTRGRQKRILMEANYKPNEEGVKGAGSRRAGDSELGFELKKTNWGERKENWPSRKWSKTPSCDE